MARTISLTLDPDSIDRAIKQLEDYRDSLQQKGNEICQRLANVAELRASVAYDATMYDGFPKDYEVHVETINNGFAVVASGETVLILEFGAGVTYGYGHPLAGQFGMGPGTYPDGKGHWDNPHGWWIPKSAGGGHTYGNAPSMAMYWSAQEARREVEQVAREVFRK